MKTGRAPRTRPRFRYTVSRHEPASVPGDVDMNSSSVISLRPALQTYFDSTASGGNPTARADQVNWRLFCFDQGQRIASMVEQISGPVRNRRVLDVACAWGGHALALAERGASIVAGDLNDHNFSGLASFCAQRQLPVSLYVGSCEALPVASASCDILVGLELIEHIPSVERFAAEIERVLAPGGIAILSTPPRFRSIVSGEPHFNLRGIAALPFRLQRPVAERVFGRSYPYPITRQYSFASRALRPFRDAGLSGQAVLEGRLAKLLGATGFGAELLWSYLVLRKASR
jgi:2-polyprenyl-3-methyl-5-hydroxy-6-metoxy-1,4-benzoquinol methylase